MAEVKNWQEMSRAIVKLIRDQYGIEEAMLKRSAMLEQDLGLSIEQVEAILDFIQEAFTLRFPDKVLDEVLRLEELCLLAAWLKGLYKQPPFISEGFAGACRALNPAAA